MGCALVKPAVAASPSETAEQQNILGALREFHYEPEEALGEGAFGEVLLVHHALTDNDYAAKRLKRSNVNDEWLQTEVSVLKTCRHPNIVFLREVVLSETHSDEIFLVMELARGGSLYDAIMKDGGVAETFAASAIIQVASALAYLHAQSIVHRDMKPENVLLLEHEDSGRSLVKLCDFGLAKMMVDAPSAKAAKLAGAQQKADLMKSRVGSHFYASPELLKDEPYDASIDLHILYMSLTGKNAFDGSLDTYGDVVNARVAYDDPAWASAPAAKALCETLLCATPAGRPAAHAVLGHPWLLAATQSDKHVNLALRYLGRVASMRDVCLRGLVHVLPPTLAKELRGMFDELDSDAKGYLNAADVRRAIKPKRAHRRRDKGSAGSKSKSRAHGSRSSEEEASRVSRESEPASRSRRDLSRLSISNADGERINVAALLRHLLQSALQQTGVGKRRASTRAAHGARRVGVVSFDMFAEAALESDATLCRRLWNAAFAVLDADQDGVVGGDDINASLATLGIELSADAARAMLQDAASARCNSTDLLRLVLKGEEAAAAAAQARGRGSTVQQGRSSKGLQQTV